jgi:glycerol-3-phosphate dehydrogenase
MSAERYDIVVIGAGIHGAGVAQAAAARGHSVLVLEQADIASGTSSRSSKLIHGGLRYLETGQYALVRECLRERALLLRLAPGLVKLQPFHIPVYADTRRRPAQLRLGLTLYAALGGLARANRFRRVPRREWSALDGLDTHGLQQVFQYWDAQTDDRLLTRAVMASAQTLGTRLVLPATFIAAELSGKDCAITYRHAGREHACETRVLVNAAGPWVNQVLAKIRPRVEPRRVELVQGTHLVLDGALSRGVYYMEAPRDGRAVFAMPWQDRLLLGTTETPYAGDPAAVAPLPQEQDYLLETLAHYFPHYRSAPHARVLDAFAGLRVLPRDGASAFQRPRDTVLHTDRAERPRVLTLYGGKLTAYRATAENVMRRLRSSLPERPAITSTRALRLSGSIFPA